MNFGAIGNFFQPVLNTVRGVLTPTIQTPALYMPPRTTPGTASPVPVMPPPSGSSFGLKDILSFGVEAVRGVADIKNMIDPPKVGVTPSSQPIHFLARNETPQPVISRSETIIRESAGGSDSLVFLPGQGSKDFTPLLVLGIVAAVIVAIVFMKGRG